MTGLLGEVDLPAPVSDRWFEDYMTASHWAQCGQKPSSRHLSDARASASPLLARAQLLRWRPRHRAWACPGHGV